MSDIVNKIKLTRIQDGICEEKEYKGSVKEINGRLFISFKEVQEDGSVVAHLLKADFDKMEWIRSGAMNSNTAFKAGQDLPFLFDTPHGKIELRLITHHYEYIKKDTHEINVSYSLEQKGSLISRYETGIVVFTD